MCPPPTDSSATAHSAILRTCGHFWQQPLELPFYGKPSNAAEGYGGRAVVGRDEDGGLKLITGETADAGTLADDIAAIARETGTYLITEFLANSDELRGLCGDTTASFRIVVLVRDGEPEFFRTSVLLPPKNKHGSNLRGGSVYCGITPDTGEIYSTLVSPGLHAGFPTHHPDTGARILGHRFTEWPALLDMVRIASRAMSPFRMQHWDIALTNRGPVILEMNYIGNVGGCQFHGPPGLYSEQYLSFRETHKVW